MRESERPENRILNKRKSLGIVSGYAGKGN